MILPIMKFEETTEQRLEKLREEVCEVLTSHADKEPIERLLSEYMDIIQVCVVNMWQFATEEEIAQASAEHLQKMIFRKYEFKGMLEVRKLL